MTRRVTLVPVEDDWRHRAACATAAANPRWFGPPETGGDLARAAVFCARCPVTAECLAYAEADPYSTGIYAGQLVRPKRGWG
ncbi:WhiB family transcriptional regulator [Pseudonocardia asaccharolytica]|uniref:4Fe-4S Wbl-type domain-containing protein n=1 Tax=Pseudonocardia asaccharolytica DSM 44247 = NBRC 16224 TaxID=1123024 RepID=A0A511D3H0_9PSEU|nr:WhiB family transcriptional regulator [Pseudonocardia asaccharolytica]GEL19322.1 hypothetical protein PA7_31590 [Pseudonocardia asaccharolytica DSM 44247 = NBRC 16224]